MNKSRRSQSLLIEDSHRNRETNLFTVPPAVEPSQNYFLHISAQTDSRDEYELMEQDFPVNASYIGAEMNLSKGTANHSSMRKAKRTGVVFNY